jgi:hypothetical protein
MTSYVILRDMNTPETTELAQLRAEVAALRRDLDHVLVLIGQHPLTKEEKRKKGLRFDARGISLRRGPTSIPISLVLRDEAAWICLCDEKMITRGKWEVTEKGARLEIRNAKGKVVVALGESKDGGGEVYIASADGLPRAGMKTRDGEGVVSVQNAEGQPMAAIHAQEKGGKISAANADGRPVAHLSGLDECGTLILKERTGATMAIVTAHGGRGVVSVMNEHGDDAAYLSSDEKGGALFICDDEGEIQTRVP